MIAPKKDAPAQQFKLRNTSGKDVRFTGWKLAEVDNFNPDAVDKGYVTGSKRWKERAVYQTEGGKIVCHKLGRSNVDGEVDRGEVYVVKPQREAPAPGTARTLEQLREDDKFSPLTADEQVLEFFGSEPMCKDLFDALGIEDVETID